MAADVGAGARRRARLCVILLSMTAMAMGLDSAVRQGFQHC